MRERNSATFIKAIRFIYDNIDQSINLTDIATAAGTSLSSLKRIFAAATHKTPGEFVRRMRMELALCSLQDRTDTVLAIALSAGFDDQAAFTRCFKEMFGYPPTQARQKLNIINELECVTLNEPDIIELAELSIQCITQQGLYFESAKKAWDILKQRLATALTDDFPGIFIGIGHDNPHEGNIAPDQVRFSAGVVLIESDLGIERYRIPAGNYARFYYMGKPMNLGLAYHYIYGKWSAQTAFTINKKAPAFTAFASVPEALTETKIFIHVPLLA